MILIYAATKPCTDFCLASSWPWTSATARNRGFEPNIRSTRKAIHPGRRDFGSSKVAASRDLADASVPLQSDNTVDVVGTEAKVHVDAVAAPPCCVPVPSQCKRQYVIAALVQTRRVEAHELPGVRVERFVQRFLGGKNQRHAACEFQIGQQFEFLAVGNAWLQPCSAVGFEEAFDVNSERDEAFGWCHGGDGLAFRVADAAQPSVWPLG